jgi:hypothetical protein
MSERGRKVKRKEGGGRGTWVNCDFSCETKIMYQTEFFLQS